MMETKNILAALEYVIDNEFNHYMEHLENEGDKTEHIYYIAMQAKADLLGAWLALP